LKIINYKKILGKVNME